MTTVSGHGWYVGDIVLVAPGITGIIRRRCGASAWVQIGRLTLEFGLAELVWTGGALERVPRTEWGWRRVGDHVMIHG